MPSPALKINAEAARSLAEEVSERSGQNLLGCYQCRRCAAGCPVGKRTGNLTPDRLIRLIVLGDRQGALDNDLVWKCVSCYTCGVRCPNNIQTARITETLKQMAKEGKLPARDPKVANFHQSFVDSAVRWGRLNELEFMGLYETKNAIGDLKKLDVKAVVQEMVSQAKFALPMLEKGRLHADLGWVKGRGEIKRLQRKAKKRAAARKAKG